MNNSMTNCTKWGEWELNSQSNTLYFKRTYEIDLSLINSSAAILDWIFQIKIKPWGNPEILFDLITAFDDIFNPQANFCSGGRENIGEAYDE